MNDPPVCAKQFDPPLPGKRFKKAYLSAQDALAEQPLQRAYLCKHCRMWHLTMKGVKSRKSPDTEGA